MQADRAAGDVAADDADAARRISGDDVAATAEGQAAEIAGDAIGLEDTDAELVQCLGGERDIDV